MGELNRYASIRAIESPSTLDDQQWLTYWVLYSFVSLFELSCWKVLVWYEYIQIYSIIIYRNVYIKMCNFGAYNIICVCVRGAGFQYGRT